MNTKQVEKYSKAVTEGYIVIRKKPRNHFDNAILAESIDDLKTLAAELIKDDDKAFTFGYWVLFSTRKTKSAKLTNDLNSRTAADHFESVLDTFESLLEGKRIDPAHYSNVLRSYAWLRTVQNQNAKAADALKRIINNVHTTQDQKQHALEQLASFDSVEGIVFRQAPSESRASIRLTNDDSTFLNFFLKQICPPHESGITAVEMEELLSKVSPEVLKGYRGASNYLVDGPSKWLSRFEAEGLERSVFIEKFFSAALSQRPLLEGLTENPLAKFAILHFYLGFFSQLLDETDRPEMKVPCISFDSKSETILFSYSQKNTAFIEMCYAWIKEHNAIARIYGLNEFTESFAPAPVAATAASASAASAGAGGSHSHAIAGAVAGAGTFTATRAEREASAASSSSASAVTEGASTTPAGPTPSRSS